MDTRRAALVLCLSTCLASFAQTQAWQKSDPGFHPLAIASVNHEMWVCDPNESIASFRNTNCPRDADYWLAGDGSMRRREIDSCFRRELSRNADHLLLTDGKQRQYQHRSDVK
jgi:hypothetical protein